MLNILKFIWQLPQNLIALVILGLNCLGKKTFYTKEVEGIKVYIVKRGVFKCGVSLGNFIILDLLYVTDRHLPNLPTVAKHEHGHQIQSLYFGPLYLLVIGLPSVINNLIHRAKGKSDRWYYSRYPERWADKLGHVERIYFL